MAGFLIDEDMPRSLAARLRAAGFDAHSAPMPESWLPGFPTRCRRRGSTSSFSERSNNSRAKTSSATWSSSSRIGFDYAGLCSSDGRSDPAKGRVCLPIAAGRTGGARRRAVHAGRIRRRGGPPWPPRTLQRPSGTRRSRPRRQRGVRLPPLKKGGRGGFPEGSYRPQLPFLGAPSPPRPPSPPIRPIEIEACEDVKRWSAGVRSRSLTHPPFQNGPIRTLAAGVNR